MVPPKQVDLRVCENFCAFYRPGRNDGLACQGALVVRRLAGTGRPLSLEKRASAPPAHGALRTVLCGPCPFRRDGCDFIAGVQDASPCGGYLVLAHLLDEGALTIDDITS